MIDRAFSTFSSLRAFRVFLLSLGVDAERVAGLKRRGSYTAQVFGGKCFGVEGITEEAWRKANEAADKARGGRA